MLDESNATTIVYKWGPPFTIEDDFSISYCVDVTNATSNLRLHSQCGISMTEFSYPVPPDSNCHKLLFTVTPVNVMGNGIGSTQLYFGVQNRKYFIMLLQMC